MKRLNNGKLSIDTQQLSKTYLVNNPKVHRLVCRHECITLDGFFNRFEWLLGVMYVDLVQAGSHLQYFLCLNLDIRGLHPWHNVKGSSANHAIEESYPQEK